MKIDLEKIMIAHSPLTGNIYAGSISKPGVWKNKVDVTDKVYAAVIEANLNQVHNMSFGDRTFELTVKEMPLIIPPAYYNCAACEMDYNASDLSKNLECPVCHIVCDCVLLDELATATFEGLNQENEKAVEAIEITSENLKALGFTEHPYEGLAWLEIEKPHPSVLLFTGDKNGYLEVVLEIADIEIKRMRYLHEVKKAIKFFKP
jgi:hypothetical protein